MKCKSLSRFFGNFANPTKLEIITLLKDKPMCVNEMVKSIQEEQSKISHNLKKLVDCHILTVKQNGKLRIYSLNTDTVLPILNLVKKHVQCHCKCGCNQ